MTKWLQVILVAIFFRMSLDHLISQAYTPKETDVVLANFRGLEWITVPVN